MTTVTVRVPARLGRASRRRTRRRLAPGPGRGVAGSANRETAGALALRWGRRALCRCAARLSVPDEDEAVARFLTSVASELRTGASLPQAVQAAAADDEGAAGSVAASVGPLGLPLRRAVAANRAGVPLVDAMAGWGRAWPTPAVCLAVTTLTVGAGVGGELARAADAAASTLRQRSAVRAEVRALSAQGRASAVVVSVAPLAFTAVACLVEPDVFGFLTGSLWGLGCVVGGLTSDLVGAVWMRRIVRGVA